MALSEAQRVEVLARHQRCYVCEDFDQEGAGVQQYSPWEIEFHAWAPQPAAQDEVANLCPIHARGGAPGPLDAGWRGAVAQLPQGEVHLLDRPRMV